jgi:hypothetical protein
MFKKTRTAVYAFVVAFVAAGIIDGFVEVIFVSIRELGLFIGVAVCMLMVRNQSDAIAYSKNQIKPRSIDNAITSLRAPSASRRVSRQSS